MKQVMTKNSRFKPACKKGREANVHEQVTTYLKMQYPKVLFRTDFGAGIKLTIGQAVKQKKLQSCSGWPDLFIADPRNGKAGLFIELKREGERIVKRDGTPASDHIAEQMACHELLRKKGYMVTFAIGFDAAKYFIDTYMGFWRL